MQVSLLVYEAREGFAARSDPAQQEAYWSGTMRYVQALRDAGVLVAGAGLEPPGTAKRLLPHDGKRFVQDGPYADTKEQLGGFFVLEVASLEEAMAWAERFPARPDVILEVRPVMAGEGEPNR